MYKCIKNFNTAYSHPYFEGVQVGQDEYNTLTFAERGNFELIIPSTIRTEEQETSFRSRIQSSSRSIPPIIPPIIPSFNFGGGGFGGFGGGSFGGGGASGSW